MKEATNPRTRILQAAAEVFAREGFAGAKVDRIAKLARVNKAALYYHVGDKDALYETVLTENVRAVGARLEAAIEGLNDPAAALSALVRTLAAQFEESALLPRIMAQEMARGGERLSEPVMREFLRVFNCTRRVMEMGRASGIFHEVNPLLAHLDIVSTLIFTEMFRTSHARISSIAAVREAAPAVDSGFSREQVVRRILDSFGVAAE
jgi:TetR/AcrR family transcriptional regulator